jgi:hypothetical protein
MACRIYAIHASESEKLDGVQAQMEGLGAPEIKVVDCGDHYMALEGSHRLAAVFALGLTPSLVVFEQNDILDVTEFDWYDENNWAGTKYTAGEIASELCTRQAVPYLFA